MTRRLMFVHAHPDDEASKGAATAAKYADERADVVLVTCTGGEAGEVLNPSADAVVPTEMGGVRASELAASVAAIGFTRTYGLGYADSGYHEDPADVPDGTFSRTLVDEPARTLAGLIRRERPQVIVTYPEDGGYPHPDHIMNHLVTVRGMDLAEDPDADLSGIDGGEDEPWRVPKVYASDIYPPERVHALHEAMIDAGLESPFIDWLKRRQERGRGPSPDPDTRIQCDAYFERRDAALRAHVSQIDPNGFWFSVPRELERRHYPYEGFTVLRSDVVIPAGEDDLFAGLDVGSFQGSGQV